MFHESANSLTICNPEKFFTKDTTFIFAKYFCGFN